MKISLPFIYQVNFKKPRSARWEHSDIQCRTDLDLMDIDPGRARIVHVVSDSSAPQFKGHGGPEKASKFHVPGGECVIRELDGQFYASRFPVEEIDKWRGDVEYDPFDAVVGLKYGESEFTQTLSTTMKRNGFHPPVRLGEFHAANPGAKKFSSERSLMDSYLVALSRRFAVIDGMIYEKVYEPVLSVVTGAPVRIYVEEALSPSLQKFYKGDWRGMPAGRIRFGLDEYDRAVATAQAIAAEKGTTVEAHASVLSVDGTSVRFRGDHEYLFDAAVQTVKQFRLAVAYMPERTGLAVINAANLLSIHDRLTPQSLAAVRRMASELADYFANHIHPRLLGHRFDEGAWEVWSAFGDDWKDRMGRLTHALAHWDARDDVGLEWLDGSLDALPVYDYPRRAYEVTSQMDLDKLEVRWKGSFPAELFRADPSSDAIIVVEDFELRQPLATLVFDRNDPDAAPLVFGIDNNAAANADVKLAETYVRTAKTKVTMSLAKALSGPAI